MSRPTSDASDLVTRIHIDTDPGLDDLLALALAFASPELKVEGISTVAGNSSLENVTANARGFLELAGLGIPIGRGAAGPRALSPATADSFHGELGRAGIPLPEPPPAQLPSAFELLRRSVVERHVECIVALGPLTNLAELISREPELLNGVEIVWMGGSLSLGNVTPLAEFNCYADPQAAAVVLGSGHAVRVIGLDVSQNVVLRVHQLSNSPFGESPMGSFLGQALLALMAAEQPVRGERCAVLHDPATIAAVACRDLFRYEPRQLEISVAEGRERGLMRRSERPLPVVSWAVEVNSNELLDLFQRRIAAWSGAAGQARST
jgi:purine nucleosidase